MTNIINIINFSSCSALHFHTLLTTTRLHI